MVRCATTAEAALAARASHCAQAQSDRPDPGLDVDWSRSLVEEGGQHHLVLIPDTETEISTGAETSTGTHTAPGTPMVVARMSRTADAAAQLTRTTELLRALHALNLPWELPLPLAGPVFADTGTDFGTDPSDSHRAAVVVQRYVPGQAHPPHCGRPEDLREICRVLAAVDTTSLHPHLAQPFAFRGPWTPAKIAALVELPQRLEQRDSSVPWPDFFPACTRHTFEDAARRIIRTVHEWTERPVVAPSLVHGDLAGHNMRWLPIPGEDRWRLNGILDWDLACLWDPALNPAYLSLWHGEEKLGQLCLDDDEHHRARVWLAAMALESLYDAGLRLEQIAPKKWRRLLNRALPRLERAAELLG